MTHTKSADKRIRQGEKRRIENKSIKSAVKTQVKVFTAAVAAGDSEAARAEYKKAIRGLDKAAKRGVYHANTVARRKSRLSRMLGDLQQA